MKVVISNHARFHAFHLAEELDKRGALDSFYTEDLLRKTDGVDPAKLKGRSVLKAMRVLEMAGHAVPSLYPLSHRIRQQKRKWHDEFVARELLKHKDADLFVTWAGNPKSIETAKNLSLVTVIDSGSTHPLFQHEILKEEHRLTHTSEFYSLDESIVKSEAADLAKGDFITVPSAFVKKTFIQNGFDDKKIRVIPYGVDIARFSRKGKRDETFRVIWCGTLCIRKGIHYLLQAFAELDLPNSELLLIGAREPEMDRFIAKYKSDKIRIIGPRPQGELASLYSSGSVFVHPSVEEGLSMVQLEAMACGLPLICTTNTGGDEIVREGKEGFIIPIRDSKSLKNRIKYLYENPSALKSMSEKAEMRARQFTWDRYGSNVMAEYQKMIGRKR